MQYRKLLALMLEFIRASGDKKNAEQFCNDYMDNYYNFQDDLENEVIQRVYEMFDDVNIICDSYESDSEIREMDKYCIDEITLRDKVIEIYREIERLTSY